jgi:hypothetical protein
MEKSIRDNNSQTKTCSPNRHSNQQIRCRKKVGELVAQFIVGKKGDRFSRVLIISSKSLKTEFLVTISINFELEFTII